MKPEQSDQELAERIRRDDRLLRAEQERARLGYEAARAACAIGPGDDVEKLWQAARGATAAAQPVHMAGHAVGDAQRMKSEIQQLRIAAETADVLEALASLGRNDVLTLTRPYTHSLADTTEARAVLKSRPALAAWLARRDAEAERLKAAQHAEHARVQADLPARLLQSPRARGVQLVLAGDGSLCAAPGSNLAAMLPSELEAVRDYKAELAALLLAEAARPGVQPVVLA